MVNILRLSSHCFLCKSSFYYVHSSESDDEDDEWLEFDDDEDEERLPDLDFAPPSDLPPEVEPPAA